MTPLLTPRRRRSFEYLDDPNVEPHVVRRSLADVSVANALFGGTRAVLRELDRALSAMLGGGTVRAGSSVVLLDVGTGVGDIPGRARILASRRGLRLTTIGVDIAETLAEACRERIGIAVRGNALALPFADGSFDVVTCSQTLHHFADPEERQVLTELHRVSRGCVIVSDLRRSWLAAAGIWLASFPLGFHPVSRHDGVISVLRGYTTHELGRLVSGAIGQPVAVRRHLGWRVTATWFVEGRASLSPPSPSPPLHVFRPRAHASRAADGDAR